MENLATSIDLDKTYQYKILSPGGLALFIERIWRKDHKISHSKARKITEVLASETILHKKFIPGNICHSPLDWFVENAVFTVGIVREEVFENKIKYPLGLELTRIFRESYRRGVDLIYSLYLYGLHLHSLLNRSILKRGIDNIKSKANEMKIYARALEYYLEDEDEDVLDFDNISFQYS